MTYKHSMNVLSIDNWTWHLTTFCCQAIFYWCIRISHMLKNSYSFPFYNFIMFCILLSNVHAISMYLNTCIFRFPQFVFIATFPLFAVNVSQRQFQSLAWSSASLWQYYQETTEWIFEQAPLVQYQNE